MNTQKLLILFLFMSFGFGTQAQMKIGYVNINLVLTYMPETKNMNQDLQTYQQKLREKLAIKQQYAKMKYQEYQKLLDSTSRADSSVLKSFEEELIKLDEEIKKAAGEADQNLMAKRQELMEPILKKLETTLKSLSDEAGYDYIFNSIDGNGVSIVLHGPEEHDLTKQLIQKLGIEIPVND